MRPGGASLTFGPRPLYSLKAAATRARSLLWLPSRAREPDDGALRILLYHRISGDSDPLSVAPHRFRAQMDVLAAGGFEVIDVAEGAHRLVSGMPIGRMLALSFDDGYADVVENALPVLEHHGFHASVFVATGLIDGAVLPAWYEQPPPLLGWDEIAELDRVGTLRFEAHSITHRNLTRLDDAEARTEIVECKQRLESRLRREVVAFSYPGGVQGKREQTLAEDAGYRVAVTCEPGTNRPGDDLFALRRTQIDARDSLLDFRAKLGGGHDTGLPGRALYRRARYGPATPERASSLAYRSR